MTIGLCATMKILRCGAKAVTLPEGGKQRRKSEELDAGGFEKLAHTAEFFVAALEQLGRGEAVEIAQF